MDDTERRTAKRSRFDQTERKPRRSRSPPASKPDPETRRSRSPLPRASDSPATDSAKKGGFDAAAAAGKTLSWRLQYGKTNKFLAAAAAKINAQIQAKKGIQHVDVPPIRSTLSPSAGQTASPRPSGSGNIAAFVSDDIYMADGDYIRDIEVNDLRNRYTLTKGSTQKMVNTPCVNTPLIHQAFFNTYRYSF